MRDQDNRCSLSTPTSQTLCVCGSHGGGLRRQIVSSDLSLPTTLGFAPTPTGGPPVAVVATRGSCEVPKATFPSEIAPSFSSFALSLKGRGAVTPNPAVWVGPQDTIGPSSGRVEPLSCWVSRVEVAVVLEDFVRT
jgi:hypothetical protein